jgi:hypothetical protein
MPASSACSRFGLLFIIAVVLIDSIGFGIILPVLPRLIISLTLIIGPLLLLMTQ